MPTLYKVVFISTPTIGNLVPTVEFAQLLVRHNPHFFATVLTISVPKRPIVNTYVQSISAASTNIKFLHLPTVDPPADDQYNSSIGYLSLLIEKHKPHVKQAISDLMNSTESDSNSGRVVGFFVDMFTTTMIDVANELGIPCYLFWASPATFLAFMLDLPTLDLQLTDTEFADSDAELIIRGFSNRVPRVVLPTAVLSGGEGYFWFLRNARRYKETKGIIVNTFQELEPFAVNSLCTTDVPIVYPIGPIVDLNGPAQWYPDKTHHEIIMKWLDKQPKSSVVFLCFGSMGSLSGPQVGEIAFGLERAGFRFLWSLREPPKVEFGQTSNYLNLNEALPSGFLERNVDKGLVCGWVPQVTILAHQAIGGFVSHCGWNSILESLWHGVPIATWPIYAEQQMNAFEMVKELRLAIEIRFDYREGSEIVLAEELENCMRKLMKDDDEVRAKVKDMREKGMIAIMENGSSHKSLQTLVENLSSN